ncbi:MAG TPA: hypothetical protein VLJ79_12660 [Candidatus Binatia bacterium]|nr:hypothetical protein [Candidatus Binatia bacterium]
MRLSENSGRALLVWLKASGSSSQYVINLSGESEVEAGNGTERSLGSGEGV